MKSISLFVKEPIPGKVKTRLAQDGISSELAAQFYDAFLKDSLSLAKSIPVDFHDVFYAPPASDHFLESLQSKGFRVFEQMGADLGQRMASFFETQFSQGMKKVVLIGSDAPNLPQPYLLDAVKALDQHKIVLGPSTDGGYYLVGLSASCPKIFSEIEWSSEKVFKGTLSNIRSLNMLGDLFLLPPWYDIDTSQDLLWLRLHLQSSLQESAEESALQTKEIFKNHPLL